MKKYLVYAVLFLIFFVAAPAFAVDIMCLGDSITHGNHTKSFRYYLWQDLWWAGYDVDFIGTQDHWTDYAVFDEKHQGHGGFHIEKVFDGYSNDSLHDNIINWISQAGIPDIVLLNAGTNDFTEDTPAEAVAELAALITRIQGENANVRIFVSKLLIADCPTCWKYPAFNALLTTTWATNQSTGSSTVSIVDANSTYDASTDSYDGLHPNNAGHEKYADVLFTALDNYLTEMRTIIVIDGDLTSNCTDEDYNKDARNCSATNGTTYDAYADPQVAETASSGREIFVIRESQEYVFTDGTGVWVNIDDTWWVNCGDSTDPTEICDTEEFPVWHGGILPGYSTTGNTGCYDGTGANESACETDGGMWVSDNYIPEAGGGGVNIFYVGGTDTTVDGLEVCWGKTGIAIVYADSDGSLAKNVTGHNCFGANFNIQNSRYSGFEDVVTYSGAKVFLLHRQSSGECAQRQHTCAAGCTNDSYTSKSTCETAGHSWYDHEGDRVDPPQFITSSGGNNFVRRLTGYASYHEGHITGGRWSVNHLFEDSILYGSKKYGSYSASSRGTTIRRNLIYGVQNNNNTALDPAWYADGGDTSLHSNSHAIGIGGNASGHAAEDQFAGQWNGNPSWQMPEELESHIRIYDNIFANRVNLQLLTSQSPTFIRYAYIFNNTLAGPYYLNWQSDKEYLWYNYISNDDVYYFITTTNTGNEPPNASYYTFQGYVTALNLSSNDVGSIEFLNNIVTLNNVNTSRVSYSNTTSSLGYPTIGRADGNLWTNQPNTSNLRGTNDPTYDDPDFSGSVPFSGSGVTMGSLSKSDFELESGSAGINDAVYLTTITETASNRYYSTVDNPEMFYGDEDITIDTDQVTLIDVERNTKCLGSSDPYSCCSGVGNGTCNKIYWSGLIDITNGDEIFFRHFEGTAPDIGAHEYTGDDTTPPTISNPLPSGEQSCTTDPRNVTIQVTTNENATCKYDTVNVTYSSMSNTFSTTGATSHSQSLSSLSCGSSYTRYVRCVDSIPNESTTSTISFSIAEAESISYIQIKGLNLKSVDFN